MIPNTKVFVGSLPAGSKPEDLRRLFENFGVVTECDIMNKCGFVWMQTEEMAQSAIAALNNTMFNGQSIVVEQGRMKDRGQNRGSGPGGPRGGGFQRDGNRGPPGRLGGGGGGPMRRGRDGPMRRNTPYGGGRNDFGGGNRPGRTDSGPMPQMPPPPAFGGGFDDNFGFSNQDRRGFALPNQYDNPQRGGPGGGFHRNSGLPRSGFRQGGFGGGGGGGNRNDSGQGRQGGGFNRGGGFQGRGQGGPKPNFNRGGGGNFGGRPNQGGGSQTYNQQFPPLGASGPGPRNNQGPPRMQNRRFQ